MIPYSDNLRHEKGFYGVTSLILVLCALNITLFLDEETHIWAMRYLGFIPILFSVHPWQNLHTLVTSPLVHADIYHLGGNLLFLWVFGRSLERLFGTLLFLVIFPALGLAGLLLHWVTYPDSMAPVIGASGAIAFLMGGYLTLFPFARVRMIFTIGIIFKRFTLPAWVFLFYWGGLQIISLMVEDAADDGVAYAVHIGGFILGAISAMAWKVSYPFAEEKLETFTENGFKQSS